MGNFLVIDLETTTKEKYGRKANPFYNDIVAIGLATSSEVTAEYIYPDKLTQLGIDEDILVGFNMSFDLLYLWHLDDLTAFFKRGGRVWDCQLAEYILTGQQHKFAALRDIAVNKYSCPQREKYMEEYWDKGVDTKDIPKELVIQDVTDDAKDTRQVYLKQVELAKQKGMYNLIVERMDGLLACIECEYNGMYIDQQILKANMEALERELIIEQEKLQQMVKRYWK